MDVRLVGAGPPAEAVAAALADADATVERGDADELDGVDLAVVAGVAGEETFERANRAALAAGVPWLAVEGGGLGGHALVDVEASVAGFTAGPGCYECLGTRVAANRDGAAGSRPDVDPAAARLAGAVAGREAVRLVEGGRSDVLGGVVEVPHAERQFLPVPGCSTCGRGRDRSLPLEAGDRPLEEALAAAERGLDERVGLVRQVGEAESFPAPYYLADVTDTAAFSDAAAAGQAAGVAAGWNEAFMKALGEALERYSAAVYEDGEFRRARSDDLAGAVPPEAFVVGEAVDEPLAWVAATPLTPDRVADGADADDAAGGAAWLPAEFVQFPPPERRFDAHITTGLGLGNSGVEAVLSGLYEVLERDATMLAWYSTFEPLGLAVEDDGYRTLVRRARSEDLAATALLATQDVDVPVVAAAVHREGEWPRFAAGSAASLDPEAAARSALAEALQNWMELRGMGPEAAADESGAIGRYAEFPEPARAFVDPPTQVPADSVGPAEVPSGRGELAALVDRVTAAGLDAYAARVTPPDVESLGFEAVRVAVPPAQPLFTGDPTFGERARTVPAGMGYEPRLDREMHPYP